ncbi:hypothetical protein [Bacillus sp. S/N-304-OC-R1]|uniref:hypothetical protein n=1 Tax=Bacillus sp. S/N-304-OC-R1 TaxID=2758034 RepID=UPI0021AE6314|nr:hypothetical protein [Bacillus sp. S/N-304-OC-R1]
MNPLNKTSNLNKTNINNNNKIRNVNDTCLDHTYTSDRVPEAFIGVVKYFFPEAKSIEEFWRMTSIAAYRHNRETEKEQILSIAIHSFKQLIGKMKYARVIKPVAYYYGIILRNLYFDELAELGFPADTSTEKLLTNSGLGELFRDVVFG